VDVDRGDCGDVSEIEFLHALRVELVRHDELRAVARRHELFQTSTIEALLAGAFDGDVLLAEILQHGDLGLGTLNGLDGELIVLDGEAWRADAACRLVPAAGASRTPYAVVVPFTPGPAVALPGALRYGALGQALADRVEDRDRPVAVRIDGQFEHVRVRSVPKQQRPYPSLAQALAQQCISELDDVTGTMVGFCFPSTLEGIEMIGWHVHFANNARTRGGHVLDFTLRDGSARLDNSTELRVELPPAVSARHHEIIDQDALGRLELDG
jgi:acetolactate decarboxylase